MGSNSLHWSYRAQCDLGRAEQRGTCANGAQWAWCDVLEDKAWSEPRGLEAHEDWASLRKCSPKQWAGQLTCKKMLFVFQMTKHDNICFIFTCSCKASIKLQSTFCLQKMLHTFSLSFVFSVENQPYSYLFYFFNWKTWGSKLSKSQQANLCKLPFPVSTDYGASKLSSAEVQKFMLEERSQHQCWRSPDLGDGTAYCSQRGSNWCISHFMCTSVRIQSHLDSQEFSLKPRLPGTAQLTTVLAAPLHHWESPGHTSEECLDGREVHWT